MSAIANIRPIMPQGRLVNRLRSSIFHVLLYDPSCYRCGRAATVSSVLHEHCNGDLRIVDRSICNEPCVILRLLRKFSPGNLLGDHLSSASLTCHDREWVLGSVSCPTRLIHHAGESLPDFFECSLIEHDPVFTFWRKCRYRAGLSVSGHLQQ